MSIKIYNTLSKKKEIFNPIKPDKIKIYVCGPTVYDRCHIGHARSAIVFDAIVKYFKVIGFKVKYVRNFTDIDDKIINKAREKNITYQELSQIYINSFHNDMQALNVMPVDFEPRVTNHIEDIINIIKILIEKNFSYISNGDVYFSVDNLKSYGKLSGRKKKDIVNKSRLQVNNNKKNPLDFTIWKSAKLGEPYWKSPWGNGRPGWHIECSAMSKKFLGETIDIHGGGKDLIFPHHENEIAQSESANQKPLANYWMHNGLVHINKEKMSKSIGNVETIENLLKKYNSETIRLFILSNHYRSPIDFSKQNLKSYEKAVTRIYRTFEKISEFTKNQNQENTDNGETWNLFSNAMNDDFNTAKGIGIMFDAVKKTNKLIDTTVNNNQNISIVNKYFNDLLLINKTLGIINSSINNHTKNKIKNCNQKTTNYYEIEKLIKERNEARSNKDWIKADEIRLKLKNMNIKLEDRINTTIWGKNN